MSTASRRDPSPPANPGADETRPLLDYAASEEGRAKIERARREIRDGQGIEVTPSYFEELNLRISRRAARVPKT